MSEEKKTVKPGISKRVFGWGQKRIRHPFLGDVSRGIVREGGKSALQGLKPQVIAPEEAREGFRGRYADGGVSRFRDMVSSLSITEEDLQTLDTFHRLQRLLNGVAGLLTGFLGLCMVMLGDIAVTRFGGVAFLVFTLVFMAGTLRHDFSLWQIRNRRMAGLSSYLSGRFSAEAR